jgi:uncharacterized ferritin-like protein (DUF455 family)
VNAPTDGIEAWAWSFLHAQTLKGKLEPAALPSHFSGWCGSADLHERLRPARPAELRVLEKAPKTPRPGAMVSAKVRAGLFASFHHHELQAAELFCWALLVHSGTPIAFRKGLVKLATDEIRHMGMYRRHVERLGYSIEDFGVRDYFWERVPMSVGPAGFCAVLGLGFEGANLDHSAIFAERFRAVGDEEGARIQEVVGEEEIEHVRFAGHWFSEFTGEEGFDAWRSHLPAPLSPILMRGPVMDREARQRAGYEDGFLEELESWQMR